jgi:aryl-alcohol dehydrogenase-like predicted oxidoreductase
MMLDKQQTRTLGRTSVGPLEVSELQLGAMHFGTRSDEASSRSLLDAFFERGGNFVDTSNNYAFWADGAVGGESERVLGRWLKDRGRRDDVVIATKCGALPNRPGAGFDDIQGLGRAAILASIEDSLKRLGTDYVDLYYAHIDDRTTTLAETLEAFAEVVRAGKVRAIGCSNHTAWRIMEALMTSRAGGLPEYVCVQHRHSYLQKRGHTELGRHRALGLKGIGTDHSRSDEHLDLARFSPGFRIIAYGPLLQGAYARPDTLGDDYRSDDNQKRLKLLASVAAETGATTGQVVLAWMLQSEPSVLPLMSASSLAQLEENLGAVAVTLSDDQLARLEAAA